MGNNLYNCIDCNHKNSASQPQKPAKIQPQQQNDGILDQSSNPPLPLRVSNNAEQLEQETKPSPIRQQLPLHLDFSDSFLTHHMKYELSLTNFSNMKRIRRRQIMQHLWLQSQWQNYVGPRDLHINFSSFRQSIFSAWMQRTFLDIWQQAHKDFFNRHLDYKQVRRKVAEQYMHELFQLKQFAESGMATLNFMFCDTQVDLNTFLQLSDDSLLHLFKKLKDRYPQTSSKDQMQFPEVPSTKSNLNIFDNFPAVSFSDPNNLNYQTIYEDINFLLTKATEQQQAFKQDMKELLGADVLACTKVSQVTKDGKTSFNACAVRRVFVKWAQNILQKCPDLYQTRSFMRFVQTRGRIANNFIFKSTVQDSTHKFVIDCVSLLLEVAKYTLKDNQERKKRQEFIFNIYDLLRCKIKRSSPTEIVNLLQKMKSTKLTKNGKKLQVIRIKNRFKTNNRDLLVNFRYGDVLVGQAQLCVDKSQLSKQAKLNYDFCHYIYQLQRSIFGPTLELMMEYEDSQRPDITVTFEAEGRVQARGTENIDKLKPIERECIQGHKMISVKGNLVYSTEGDQGLKNTCNYCDSRHPVSKRYDYCYFCGCILCTDCREDYQKTEKSVFDLSVQSQSLVTELKSLKQLQNSCKNNKALIVLFWLENSSPSEILKDGFVYQQCKQIMQLNKYIPEIAMVKYGEEQESREIIRRYKIDRFPTMILFDENALPYRTVIGCSWFQVPVLYKLQKLMIVELSTPVTKNYCIQCRQEMFLKEIDKREEMVCQVCYSYSKLYQFPQQLRNQGYFCGKNHYKCINCSYVSFNQPTVHQDFMGYSYLSSSFVGPIIEKCQKGHKITLVHDGYPSEFSYICLGCQQQRYVNNQHGVGECQQCKVKFCQRCLGANEPTLQQLETNFQLIKHTVESTAEDSYPCICKRFFKKTYQIRPLTKLIPNLKNQTWKCLVCQSKHKEGELHIACFCCPVSTQENGQSTHFEICYSCATKSKIVSKPAIKKVKESKSYFGCPKDNLQLVFGSFCSEKNLTFQCHFCNNKFYRNTKRYHCKKCGLNVCKQCKEQLVKHHFQPPKCQQTCPNNHPLRFQFIRQDKRFYFCDGCNITLVSENFQCIEDDYALCLKCTKNNPADFKGSGLKLKELEESQMKLSQIKPNDKAEVIQPKKV